MINKKQANHCHPRLAILFLRPLSHPAVVSAYEYISAGHSWSSRKSQGCDTIATEWLHPKKGKKTTPKAETDTLFFFGALRFAGVVSECPEGGKVPLVFEAIRVNPPFAILCLFSFSALIFRPYHAQKVFPKLGKQLNTIHLYFCLILC